MRSPTRAVLVAAMLVTVFGVAPRAQTATSTTPTNEVILARIAALEQEIEVLKAQLQPAPLATSSHQTTLAEASAEAKKQIHEWPAMHTYTSTDVKPGTATAPAAVATSPEMPSAESARQEDYRRAAMKDEMYWKDRMQALRAKDADDRTVLAAALKHAASLDTQRQAAADRFLRAQLEAQWQEALADVGRLRASVTNDVRAIATAEEEARRANVPPGWLRP